MSPRALIVEDDHATQTLLEAVLAREAIRCDHAANGALALRMIGQTEYDAVVLDLLLPGVNGFDVLRELTVRRPDVLARTVVITAAAESVWRPCDEIRLVRCVLRKPIDILELVRHVRACMSAAGVRQA